MIVVSDTSPLNYLVLINQIHLLPQLFKEVRVPRSVLEEMRHPQTPEAVASWLSSAPAWLVMDHLAPEKIRGLNLDPGESEAISLALEIGAEAILIDEKRGRRIAGQYGIRTLGTLTVLELAAEANLVDLRIATNALRQTSFHIADHLIAAALERDSARRQGES